MPIRAKEKEMAKKYGQEVKLSGFTRGGIPVGKRTGAKSPKATTANGGGFSKRELVALGIAGGLTASAVGLIGAGAASMRSNKLTK
jgi:hypothetical protein